MPSKRLWRYYLRAAERTVKVLRIINMTFIIGSTMVVIVLVSLFTPLFSKAVVYVLMHLPLPAIDDAQAEPSAYVVLGGGLTNDKNNRTILNAYSLNRARAAAAAYHDKPLPMVLSGAEAPWLKAWLSQHGVNDVISENASMNTCENARFTAKRADLQHVYLVTDGYHMTRARRQFALNNISTTPVVAPLPVNQSWSEPAHNLTHSRRAVYEVLAYMRDILRPQPNCRKATDVSTRELMTPRGKAPRPEQSDSE